MAQTEEESKTATIPKYIICPKFWKGLELGAINMVGSFNRINGKSYLNFIGIDKRIYRIAEDDIGLLIKNVPAEEDFEDYARLVKEAEIQERDFGKKREDKSIS